MDNLQSDAQKAFEEFVGPVKEYGVADERVKTACRLFFSAGYASGKIDGMEKALNLMSPPKSTGEENIRMYRYECGCENDVSHPRCLLHDSPPMEQFNV